MNLSLSFRRLLSPAGGALVACALAVPVTACKEAAAPPAKAASTQAPPPPSKAADPNAPGVAPGPMERPPHPTMATSAFGQGVLESLSANAPAPASGLTPADAFARLGSMTDTAEAESRQLGAALYKVIDEPGAKAEAASVVMLGLVMDPDPHGYLERLTDAYGVELFLAVPKRGGRLVEGARAVALAAAGRTTEAMPAAERVGEGDNKDVWQRYLQGAAFALQGANGRALQALDVAAADKAAPARVFWERGKLRLRTGDTDGARADANQALKLAPSCSRCQLLLAEAVAQADKPAEALPALSALAAGSAPVAVKAEALLVAAEVQAGQGRAEEAGALAEQLRVLKGFELEAKLAAGVTAAAAGRPEEALLALDEAVRRYPPGVLRGPAMVWLARSALATKNAKRAAEAVKAAERDVGTTPELLDLAAQALEMGGDREGARDERLRAYAMDPADAARAAAVGLKVRPASPAARAALKSAWRMVGVAAPWQALATLKELEKKDARNPYLALARFEAQKGVDATITVDKEPGDEAGAAAAQAVIWLGKEPASQAYARPVRLAMADMLDRSNRTVSADALKKMVGDPDPRVAKMVGEAVARPAARPRAKKDEMDSH